MGPDENEPNRRNERVHSTTSPLSHARVKKRSQSARPQSGRSTERRSTIPDNIRESRVGYSLFSPGRDISAEADQTAKSRLTLSRRWIERIASAKRAATLTTVQLGGRGSAR